MNKCKCDILKLSCIGRTEVFLSLPDDLTPFSNCPSTPEWPFVSVHCERLFVFRVFAPEGLHCYAAKRQMFCTQADAESDSINNHLNVIQFSRYTQWINRMSDRVRDLSSELGTLKKTPAKFNLIQITIFYLHKVIYKIYIYIYIYISPLSPPTHTQ